MENFKSITLPNEPILACELAQWEVEPIWQEVRSIMDDFDQAQRYNDMLMGNITHEYKLSTSIPVMQRLAQNLLRMGDYPSQHTNCRLAGAWVNLQQKHEFNPPHIHDGKFVVVIYLKVPYTREQELQVMPKIPLEKNLSGMLCIQYPDVIGRIRSFNIDTDASFENKMLLFPAQLTHSVFPFHSSNDVRITVSGNLY